MSTADKVLSAMRSRGCKIKEPPHGLVGEYRSNSPLRADSVNPTFVLSIDGPEHGKFIDNAGDASGSLYDLAKLLGIELPALNNSTPHEQSTSKRVYAGLADYAQAHGVEASVYEAAGWKETVYQNRPALEYPTANGPRYRFLDGKQPSYINIKGYVPCLYGLTRALAIAKETEAPALILCNGEASTVVAQHYGLPAFATTRGEKQLAGVLLDEIKDKYGKHLWIAFDCDETGRKAAKEVAAQYPDSTVLDLGLGDKGDLADLCTLHQTGVKAALAKLVDKAQQPMGVSGDRIMKDYILTLGNEPLGRGRPIPFPFPSFRPIGGLCDTLLPGKVGLILGGSGTGKTAWIESAIDQLNIMGENGCGYGMEWTLKEIGRRRVARNGGSDLTAMALYDLWQYEERLGVPEAQRYGKRLSIEQEARNAEIASKISRWPGQVLWYEEKTAKKGDDIEVPIRSIEQLLALMENDIDLMRRKGKSMSFCVFDYMQLLKSETEDHTINRYEHAFEEIKYFTQRNAVFSFVLSQVNKAPAKDQKSNGAALMSEDMAWIKEDKANLAISLNLDFDVDEMTKIPRLLGTGYALVTKNSAGQPFARVNMIPELERYAWRDPMLLRTKKS